MQHAAGRKLKSARELAGTAKRRDPSGLLSLVQIFSSMRFGDTHGVVPMAEALQAALEARGIKKNHIINMKAGGDINAEVFSKIEASEIFLVFGSAKYGEDTGNQASTFYESQYAHKHKKKIILIRMIPFGAEFEFLQARIMFGANKLEVPWMVGEPMPPDLPDKIIEAIQPAAASGPAAAAPATSLGLPPNHAAPMPAASPTPSVGAAAAKVNTQETVGALLGTVNLSAFVPYFEEEGYDYVSDLINAEDSDVDALVAGSGMKKPQQKRFRTILAELKGEGAAEAEEAAEEAETAAVAKTMQELDEQRRQMETDAANRKAQLDEQAAEQRERMQAQQAEIERKQLALAEEQAKVATARAKADEEAASLALAQRLQTEEEARTRRQQQQQQQQQQSHLETQQQTDEPEPEPQPEPQPESGGSPISEFARGAEAAGRADKEMPAGTRVEIRGRRGVYTHFGWRMMGANHHQILFDGERQTTTVQLRDETQWRVVGASPRLTNETIREAVKAFCEEGGGKEKADFLHSPQAEAKYGPVSAWDVSAVTNMEELFDGCKAFNQPLGEWKVDQVTNMSQMFYYAAAFNQPLGAWKVDQVTSMHGMFYGAAAFNQPLGAWKVDQVTSMHGMFYYAAAFNQPLGAWKVDQVTSMHGMFQYAAAFNQPLDAWTVNQGTNMVWMFDGAAALTRKPAWYPWR